MCLLGGGGGGGGGGVMFILLLWLGIFPGDGRTGVLGRATGRYGWGRGVGFCMRVFLSRDWLKLNCRTRSQACVYV